MDREAKIESGLSELESNPHDLTPLKRLEHEVVEDWEAFVDELERRGETADDPAVAGRFLLEAGRLASTRLDDADRAAQLVRRSEEAEEGGVLEPEARMYSLALEESFGELVGFFEQAFEAAAEQS
ncbi:MAG: hypothetical protein ABEL76_03110 [Bradymonadaceae bacterium]